MYFPPINYVYVCMCINFMKDYVGTFCLPTCVCVCVCVCVYLLKLCVSLCWRFVPFIISPHMYKCKDVWLCSEACSFQQLCVYIYVCVCYMRNSWDLSVWTLLHYVISMCICIDVHLWIFVHMYLCEMLWTWCKSLA